MSIDTTGTLAPVDSPPHPNETHPIDELIAASRRERAVSRRWRADLADAAAAWCDLTGQPSRADYWRERAAQVTADEPAAVDHG